MHICIYAPFISKYTHTLFTYAYISQVRELLHDLMVIALGGGGGDWVERLADSSARSSRKVDLPMSTPDPDPNPNPHRAPNPNPHRAPNPNQVDLLMFGDFGKDQDDEKALAMAVTLQHA